MTTPPTQVKIANNKYTITFGGEPHTPFAILRYGEEWLDCHVPGAKAWIAAACEIEELREENAELKQRIAELEGDVESYRPRIPADGYWVKGVEDGRLGVTSTEGRYHCGDGFLWVDFRESGLICTHESNLTPATRADVIAAGLDPDAGLILGEQE